MNQEFDDFDRPHPQQPEQDPFDTFFTDETLHAIVQALPVIATDTADDRLRRNAAAMHLLRSLDAGHPVEAAIATQAVLSHFWSVAAFHRATSAGQLPGTTASEIDTALRSSDRFCQLLSELDRWQGNVSSVETSPREPKP
jgi:hypothetical protein